MPARHVDRLREALAPDPSAWRFTGIVNDTGVLGGGKCACGHEVRYEFVIQRPADCASLVIGSRCIRTAVPYLCKAGAREFADQLEDAAARHARELRREKRDGAAHVALRLATADLLALCSWFEREQARFRTDPAARGEEVVALPDDLEKLPRLPEPAESPGRTLNRVRRRYERSWKHANRYAHEHGAEPPRRPHEPELRNEVAQVVVSGFEDKSSEFHAASRFARLIADGVPSAHTEVPAPAEAHVRRAFTRPK